MNKTKKNEIENVPQRAPIKFVFLTMHHIRCSFYSYVTFSLEFNILKSLIANRCCKAGSQGGFSALMQSAKCKKNNTNRCVATCLCGKAAAALRWLGNAQ